MLSNMMSTSLSLSASAHPKKMLSGAALQESKQAEIARAYAENCEAKEKAEADEMFKEKIALQYPGSFSSPDGGRNLKALSLEEKMIQLFAPPKIGTSNNHPIAEYMNRLEEEFLNQRIVTNPNVTERELVARYNKTSMNVEPMDAQSYTNKVIGPAVKDSVHCCAPTMIGHMTTSLPYYMRPLSKLLTTIHANNVKVETAKSQTFLEKEALAMLHRELFNANDQFYREQAARPDLTLGVVCSGGTIANNTALWIARNKALPPSGSFKGVDKSGLFKGLLHYKYAGAVVIGSEVMHYSMKKAADVLGLGTEDGLLTIPFDHNYQVKVDVMRQKLEDCKKNNICVLAIVGVAGGTETGSIDDLDAIAKLAKEYKVHFHVDAAWGGPVIFSAQHKAKMFGIERADTITLDGHKQLYTPMGCGICFLRDPAEIAYVEKTANYIIRKDSYDLGKFTMEGSRPAVASYLHANLSIMGVSGYGALVDRCIRHVRFMVEALKKTGEFEEVLMPMTNILLYRYVPVSMRLKTKSAADPLTAVMSAEQNAAIDKVNVEMQNMQKLRGSTFVSRTTIFSPKQQCRVVALRVVIANPLTTEVDILTTLKDQLEIVKKIDGFY